MYRSRAIDNSNGLGILPLVLVGAGAAAGVAATAGAQAVSSSWTDGWLRAMRQAAGWAPDPVMKPAPAPQFQPPPAPQTAAKMATWSTDDLVEAQAQRAVQWQADKNYLAEVMSQADSAAADRNAGGVSAWWLAAGAAGLFLILWRR